MRFEKFYYIPPHAVERFKERVAQVTTRQAREIILQNLQKPEIVKVESWNQSRSEVCKGTFGKVVFYIPIVSEKEKQDGDKVVPTILTEQMMKESYAYQVPKELEESCIVNRRKGRHWNERDDEYLKKRYNGHNAGQIAKVLERTVYAVQRRVTTLGIANKRAHIAPSSIRNLRSWARFNFYFSKMKIEQKETYFKGKKILYGESENMIIIHLDTFFDMLKKE